MALGPREQLGAPGGRKLEHAREDLDRPQTRPFGAFLGEEIVDHCDLKILRVRTPHVSVKDDTDEIRLGAEPDQFLLDLPAFVVGA